MEKIPVAETNYGIVKRSSNPQNTINQLIELKDSLEFAREAARRNRAISFNFHASSPNVMGTAALRKPGNFRVGEFGMSQPSFPAEIAFQRDPNADHYVLELPGVKLPLNLKIRRNREEQRRVIVQAIDPRNFYSIRAERALKPAYHLYRMPLADKRQQKYLHPAISEKIAAAIHERISRK